MSTRRNAVHLYIIQGTNILVPLLALPYLGRALGPEAFGTLAFSQLILQYLILTTDFGFNLTATRRISQANSNRENISEIVINTSVVRMALAFMACAIVYTALSLAPSLTSTRALILISFVSVIGSVMTPAWLFHGLEKNHIFAAISAAPRFLSLIPLAVYVKTPSDLELAAWLQFAPQFITGILCLAWIAVSKPFDYTKPKLSRIRYAFTDGIHIYTSTILSSIYIYVNGIIIRFVGGEAALGLYSASEKLVKAVGAMTSPAVQAIYPRVCAGSNPSLKYIYAFVITFTSLCWVGAVVLGDWLVPLIYGRSFVESASVLKVLTISPIFAGLTMISVQLKILAWGEHKRLKWIYATSVAFHCIQAPLMVNAFSVVGAAASVVLTEFLTFVLVARTVKRIRIHNKQFNNTATSTAPH